MNNKLKIGLLFLTVAALVVVPGVSANSGYFSALTNVYGNTGTSCNTCHNPSPPSLGTPYGNAFAANSTHTSNPTAVLIALGSPPGVPTPTVTPNVTPNVTPTVTSEPRL